ncbi:hypothetical protein PROFUN_00143 [Planoprotostelium fungivorum]|uniref:Peptidase S54 rhomboid domain-containing protein n=1 Tax=Planoprotostelium fungivorum TaxID=1890364 RepID=A0A2P6P0R5_9EUKA|nr:hypothetical protein PROFUN_00143 [Planoprotostelium fungivorum]
MFNLPRHGWRAISSQYKNNSRILPRAPLSNQSALTFQRPKNSPSYFQPSIKARLYSADPKAYGLSSLIEGLNNKNVATDSTQPQDAQLLDAALTEALKDRHPSIRDAINNILSKSEKFIPGAKTVSELIAERFNAQLLRQDVTTACSPFSYFKFGKLLDMWKIAPFPLTAGVPVLTTAIYTATWLCPEYISPLIARADLLWSSDAFLPLFTTQFVHLSFAHLFACSAAWFVFARAIEIAYGWHTLLILVLVCGAMALDCQLTSNTALSDDLARSRPVVGLSGIIFGLMGFGLCAGSSYRTALHQLSRYGQRHTRLVWKQLFKGYMPVALSTVILTSILDVLISYTPIPIASVAHYTGLLMGAILGITYRRSESRDPSPLTSSVAPLFYPIAISFFGFTLAGAKFPLDARGYDAIKGVQCMEDEKYEVAVEHLKKTTRTRSRDEDDQWGLMLYAISLRKAGREKEALSAAEKVNLQRIPDFEKKGYDEKKESWQQYRQKTHWSFIDPALTLAVFTEEFRGGMKRGDAKGIYQKPQPVVISGLSNDKDIFSSSHNRLMFHLPRSAWRVIPSQCKNGTRVVGLSCHSPFSVQQFTKSSLHFPSPIKARIFSTNPKDVLDNRAGGIEKNQDPTPLLAAQALQSKLKDRHPSVRAAINSLLSETERYYPVTKTASELISDRKTSDLYRQDVETATFRHIPDVESLRKLWRLAPFPLTVSVTLTTTILYAASFLYPRLIDPLLAQSLYIWLTGDISPILTTNFVHLRWWHLLPCCLTFTAVARVIEISMGWKVLLAVIITCGLAATSSQIWMNTSGGDDMNRRAPVLGLAGIVFGLISLGYTSGSAYRNNIRHLSRHAQLHLRYLYPLFKIIILVSMFVYSLDLFLMTSHPPASPATLFGGALSGALIGLSLRLAPATLWPVCAAICCVSIYKARYPIRSKGWNAIRGLECMTEERYDEAAEHFKRSTRSFSHIDLNDQWGLMLHAICLRRAGRESEAQTVAKQVQLELLPAYEKWKIEQVRNNGERLFQVIYRASHWSIIDPACTVAVFRQEFEGLEKRRDIKGIYQEPKKYSIPPYSWRNRPNL